MRVAISHASLCMCCSLMLQCLGSSCCDQAVLGHCLCLSHRLASSLVLIPIPNSQPHPFSQIVLFRVPIWSILGCPGYRGYPRVAGRFPSLPHIYAQLGIYYKKQWTIFSFVTHTINIMSVSWAIPQALSYLKINKVVFAGPFVLYELGFTHIHIYIFICMWMYFGL